jgi:hypothetical protein
VLAAAIVIVVHHLGYWSCRNKILIPITLALTVLTVAFLATGSWIAPALAHVVVHATLIVRGSEMPPHARATEALAHDQLVLPRAA